MKFRKKPVVIEAMRYTGESQNVCDLANWMGEARERMAPNGKCQLLIPTFDGLAVANVGDWVLKREVGHEFYPCKADEFETTYEPVEEGA